MTREEARIAVRQAIADHYREHGEYVENLGQEVPIAALSARIDKRIAVADFEEALDVMRRREELENASSFAIDGDRAEHLKSIEEELTAAIIGIAGNGPRGES